MRITQIDLQNIGVYQNLSLSFPEKKKKDKAEIHIFTGENGSGKSTLLHSLVAWNDTIETYDITTGVGGYNINRDPNKLLQKFYADDSSIKVSFHIPSPPSDLFNILDECLIVGKMKLSRVFSKKIYDYSQAPYYSKTNFAFFAYSGNRSIVNSSVNPTYNLDNSNLSKNLDFYKPINSELLLNWIASTKTKQVFALANKDVKRAESVAYVIQKLEKAISDIIGKDIEFILTDRPQWEVQIYQEEKKISIDGLPDGLKSIIGWIGDLLMRLDNMDWQDDTPIFERNIILFLDEIEIHLHPAWQRKVLPIVQKLFPNAQIFLSTHSPFVVNSVDGAYIYELKYENGETTIAEPTISSTFKSIDYVLENVFGVKQDYGVEAEKDLDEFYDTVEKVLHKEHINKKIFLEKAYKLAIKNPQIQTKIQFELQQLNEIIGKEEYVI